MYKPLNESLTLRDVLKSDEFSLKEIIEKISHKEIDIDQLTQKDDMTGQTSLHLLLLRQKDGATTILKIVDYFLMIDSESRKDNSLNQLLGKPYSPLDYAISLASMMNGAPKLAKKYLDLANGLKARGFSVSEDHDKILTKLNKPSPTAAGFSFFGSLGKYLKGSNKNTGLKKNSDHSTMNQNLEEDDFVFIEKNI